MPIVSADLRIPKLFQGLADPSRLSLLYALVDGPRNVSELVEQTGLSQSNASNHLACLLGCGLVKREKDGRFHFYRHADDGVGVLLAAAERLVDDAAAGILECPHCGPGL